MAMTLEDLVSTDVVPEPHAIIIVGEPGVGKSSLIGNLRDVLVVQLIREKTWANLKQTGAVPRNVAVAKKTIDSWTAMLTLIESLMSESIKTLPYKWLAIDSLTPLEGLLFKHVLETRYGGDETKYSSYNAGPRSAVPIWERFLDSLDRLRMARGMNIAMTAHHATRSQNDAEGADYDRNTAGFDKGLWAKTYPWADAVLFARYRTVNKDGKIKGGTSRYLLTGGVAACDAKNRYGLPREIEMGTTGKEAADNLTGALWEAVNRGAAMTGENDE
jgi:hypothetical protein